MTKIEEIKETVDALQFLQKAKHGGYVCPWCGSGRGKNGTGALKHYPKDGKVYCHVCEKSGDVLDVYQAVNGCSRQEAMKKLGGGTWVKPRKADVPKTVNKDWTKSYEEWAEHIGETTYHRGLSMETLAAYRVGYCSDWVNPAVPSAPPSPRLIIPVGRCNYLARYAGKGGHKYKKLYVGQGRPCFNMAALRQEKPCFIVEGEIDALSIIDAGGCAVGLGGVNKDEFLDAVRKEPPRCALILALDNDGAGKRGREKMESGLRSLGIPFYVAPPLPEDCKDANDYLVKNRDAFRSYIEKAMDVRVISDAKQYERSISCLSHIDEIRQEIARTAPFSSVGFPQFDDVLGGGLYEGLYIIGAISSLGKTTFSLQLADQVAAMGQDVLIFSLEMSRRELVCKSVSRLTGNCSTRDVATYKQACRESIDAAFGEYETFAGRLYIIEGMGDVTVLRIRESVTRHIQITGRKPLVIVDYLQIIAPSDARATDKQNTDRNVLELKRISRDYSIPVWAVSSFNRENYTSPVNMAAFKESGAVEYSSDVLIGLQWAGMEYKSEEPDKKRLERLRKLQKENDEAAKAGRAVHVQLKVLKNRNGYKGSLYYEFTPKYNGFEECMGEPVSDADIDELMS